MIRSQILLRRNVFLSLNETNNFCKPRLNLKMKSDQLESGCDIGRRGAYVEEYPPKGTGL